MCPFFGIFVHISLFVTPACSYWMCTLLCITESFWPSGELLSLCEAGLFCVRHVGMFVLR